MSALTPPRTCDHCIHLSQTIVELQERISMLHKIHDDERFLDSMVILGAASSAAPGIELDSTVPVQPLEDGRWNELGAKPKRVGRVSLTPSPNIQSSTPHSDWQTAHNNRSSKSPHLPDPLNPRDIQLSNRFGVFHEEDFPPLDRHYGSGSRDQRGNQPRSPGARPAQGRPRSPCSPSAAGSAVTKAPPAVTKRSRNRRGNKPRSPGARPPQGCQRLPCSPSAAGSAVTKATPAVTEAAVTTRGTRPAWNVTEVNCLVLTGLPVILGDDPSAYFKVCLQSGWTCQSSRVSLRKEKNLPGGQLSLQQSTNQAYKNSKWLVADSLMSDTFLYTPNVPYWLI
ncbi:uncharacterized protein LOC144009389 isoform X2 [Festucalex cinctus]